MFNNIYINARTTVFIRMYIVVFQKVNISYNIIWHDIRRTRRCTQYNSRNYHRRVRVNVWKERVIIYIIISYRMYGCKPSEFLLSTDHSRTRYIIIM